MNKISRINKQQFRILHPLKWNQIYADMCGTDRLLTNIYVSILVKMYIYIYLFRGVYEIT